MISINEVSNNEYQQFVDEGGYENPKYWDFPFQVGDNILDFNSTVKLFTDKYGKLGQLSRKYPFSRKPTGISWFEANINMYTPKCSMAIIWKLLV